MPSHLPLIVAYVFVSTLFSLGLVYWLLKRRRASHGVALSASPEATARSATQIRVPFPQLRPERARSHARVMSAMAAFYFVYAGVIVAVLSPGLTSRAMDRTSTLGIGLAVLLGLGLVATLAIPYALGAEMRKALNATLGKPLAFSLDEQGLRVPIFLLANPAFFRAADAGFAHLIIPWGDITGWSVEAGHGKTRPMHVLEVKGASESFGGHVPGTSQTKACIAFWRAPLAAREEEILVFAQRHLTCAITINDESSRKAS